MGKSYLKIILREFKESFGRFIAIFGIVALGVGFLSGLLVTTPNMNDSVDKYYDDYNTADIFIKSTMGLTEDDLEEVSSNKDVKNVMPAYVIDKILDVNNEETMTAKIYGLPLLDSGLEDENKINKLDLLEGRMPKNNKECLVERKSQYIEDIKIGSTLKISPDNKDYKDIDELFDVKEYKVVGIVGNSFHFAIEREPSNVGSGTLDTIVYVDRTSYGLEEFTDFYIVLEDSLRMNSFSSEYETYTNKARKSLEELGENRSIERKDEILNTAKEKIQEGYEEYEEEKNKVEKELADALEEINDGKKELENATVDIKKAEEELIEGRNKLESENKKALTEIKNAEEELRKAKLDLEQGEKELENAEIELEDGEKELSDGLSQALEGKKQLEKAINEIKNAEKTKIELEGKLEELNITLEELYQQKEELEDALGPEQSDSNPDLEAIILAISEVENGIIQTQEGLAQVNEALEGTSLADLENQLSELNKTISELREKQNEIEYGKKELETARIGLESGRKEYENGIAELEKAKKTLENQTYEARQELIQGEKELEEGRKEYEKGLIDLEKAEKDYEEGKEEAEEELGKAYDELLEAEEEIKDLEDPQWYVLDRDSNLSYASFKLNADKVDAISKVFPIFFYLVAGLVALTTMTRMVEEERTQIGVLKALGYKKSTIILKYILYCGLASVLGSIVGQLVGFEVIPRVIWNTYGVMYHLPEFITDYNKRIALLSSGVAILSTLIATFFAANEALKEKPAYLMIPKPPKKGKRIFLEKITPLWSAMSFNLKSTARNIFRYKKHFYMTVIGISGCTALLVTGFGLRDSMEKVGTSQFDEIFKYQLEIQLEEDYSQDSLNEISLDNPAIKDKLELFSDEGYVLFENESENINLIGVDDLDSISEYVLFKDRKEDEVINLTNDKVVITEKIAEFLNIKEGDLVTYENSDEVKKQFQVDRITENYIGNYIYMGKSNYEDAFNKKKENNIIYAKTKELESSEEDKLIEDLYENEDVLGVELVSQSRSMFDNLIDSMNYIVVIIIIASGLLAFIVLYNLTNININERSRELATLKVLGFHNSEVAAYIFREVTILAIIGTIVGLVLGKFLHQFIIITVEDPDIMFGRNISFLSYLLSAVITMIFSAIVDLSMIKKIKDIKMVDSMKAND